MATTYDKASLVMIPSGYKDDKLYSVKPTDGSGDFTFSRDGAGASPATRVNASGLIEKGRTNELTYSNTFSNAVWNKVGVTLTTGQADPFGGNNATKVDFAAGVNSYLFQGLLGSTNVRTRSIWMRADSNIEVSFSDGITANPINITTSWVRYEAFKVNSLSSGIQIDNYFSLTTPQQAISVYIYAAQVEDGLVATDYIETTATPVSAGLLGDMPRLDYSGGATCPSLLLEPSRVNLVTQSEYLDSYVKLNGTANDNVTTSPEGVQNGGSFIPNTTSGVHALRSNLFTQSATASHSWFVKANGYSKIAVRESELVGHYASFDISSGELISTDQTGTIEDYGNGWYRCTLIDTTTGVNAQTSIVVLPDSYTSGDPIFNWSGDGVKGVFAYGAQVELGSYPTSYIPTYGSASTRGADQALMSTNVNDIVGGGNKTTTLFSEINLIDGVTNFAYGIRLSSTGLYSDFISLVFTSYGYPRAELIIGGSTIVNTIGPTNFAEGYHKLCFKIDETQAKLFVDGSLEQTLNITTPVMNFNEIYISGYPDGGARNSSTKQSIIFPTALTDAECIALTTI